MENKANSVVSTKTLPFTATVSLGDYYDESTRETRKYVSTLLTNPFEGEDFEDIRISPKWNNLKGTFNYNAKRYLKNKESFEIEGEIKLAKYYSKKKRREVTYPGMFVRDPFGEHIIEFAIKREEDAAVFSMLASRYFDTALESETSETDSPLN